MRAKGSFKYVLLIIPDLKKSRRQKVPSEPVSGFFTQMRPYLMRSLFTRGNTT